MTALKTINIFLAFTFVKWICWWHGDPAGLLWLFTVGVAGAYGKLKPVTLTIAFGVFVLWLSVISRKKMEDFLYCEMRRAALAV
ncbi:MAG: hypothetical protein QF437_27060 [Planctomycetota bacterium]|jgi:hypothetical protein|nr:hypothetical protein [Planctomycetota bacterium]MDP7134188.1 hypothetical protein [Planctomycetota bacterium]